MMAQRGGGVGCVTRGAPSARLWPAHRVMNVEGLLLGGACIERLAAGLYR